jgi:hypothetical protein
MYSTDMLPFEELLPSVIWDKIYSFDSKHKDNYNEVMKELSIRFNDGLWWLMSKPNDDEELNEQIKSGYIVLPGSVCFMDYCATEAVCMQALNREIMLGELLELGSGPGVWWF